jgi:hypothetical protein
LKSRLELNRLQRSLDEKARRASRPPASLTEELYLEIVPLLSTQPDVAEQRLRALADLLATLDDPDDEQKLFLQLVNLRLEDIHAQRERRSLSQGRLIEQRMAAARELAATNPQQARRIYQSLIALFGDKAWAADALSAARRELEALPAASNSDAQRSRDKSP